MKLESGKWTWRNPQPGPAEGTTVRKLAWKTEGPCDNPLSTTPCWNWVEVSTRDAHAYGASFGGNCEGATWTDPVAAAGETVPGFRQQDSSFQETVPAYHPKSCQGSVWMGSPTDDGSGGSRVAE